MSPSDKHNEDLPADLIEALRDENSKLRVMSRRADQLIAKQADLHFETGSRRSLQPAWFAVAASVLISVLLLQTYLKPDSPGAVILSDVDHSGQLDIGDILALARDSKNFSQEDIDSMALQLVALDRSGDPS